MAIFADRWTMVQNSHHLNNQLQYELNHHSNNDPPTLPTSSALELNWIWTPRQWRKRSQGELGNQVEGFFPNGNFNLYSNIRRPVCAIHFQDAGINPHSSWIQLVLLSRWINTANTTDNEVFTNTTNTMTYKVSITQPIPPTIKYSPNWRLQRKHRS